MFGFDIIPCVNICMQEKLAATVLDFEILGSKILNILFFFCVCVKKSVFGEKSCLIMGSCQTVALKFTEEVLIET